MRRIAIDQDQVLADLNTEWVRRYNYDYNDTLGLEDLTCWDWSKVVKPECGKKIYGYLDDPELFENLAVFPDSQEVTLKLLGNFELFIITSPWSIKNVEPKDNWLKKNFPHLNADNFVYTRNKSIARANYLIDDKPANLIAFVNDEVDSKGILFDSPHNRSFEPIPHFFERINNWKEIDKYFDSIGS